MLTPPAPAGAQLIRPWYPEWNYYPSPVRALASWQRELAAITPQAGLL